MKTVFLTTLLLAAACSSPDLYEQNRAKLDQANTLLASRDYRSAEGVLQTLVADTHPAAKKYALQRAFAFYLLSRLHLEAGAGDAFMTEPNERGGTHASPAGHLVSSSFWTSLGVDELQRAEFQRGVTDLPESLQALGRSDVDLRLLLNLIVVNASLGFDARTSELVDDLAHDNPEFLSSYERCQQEARAVGLIEPVDAWLYLALHRHFGGLGGLVNQESAYQFGILARDAFLAGDSTQGRAIANDIVQWIVTHPDYRFESSAGTRFQENQPICVLSGDTSIQFRAVNRK